MANRYIPFGYRISDAKINAAENEAEIVRNIFGLYIQGLSLEKIAERLNIAGISYAGDGRKWDKNIVKRILDNPKYIGDRNYPAIILTDTARMVSKIKSEKAKDQICKRQDVSNVYRKKARCSLCGGGMIKYSGGAGRKKYLYWRCNNKNCEGYSHTFNEKSIISTLTAVINKISEEPKIVEDEICKDFEKDETIVYAENALNAFMEGFGAEDSEMIENVLNLASAKFNSCKYGDNTKITQNIKSRIAMYPKNDIADINIVNDIVKAIKISPCKTITIELINGKEITSENI